MWSLCNYVFKFSLFCLAPVSLVSMFLTWYVMVTIPHVSGALSREVKVGQRDAGWKKTRNSYDKVGTSQIIPRDILIGSFRGTRALLKLWKPFLQQSLDKHLVLILVFNQWEALLATRVFSFTAFFPCITSSLPWCESTLHTPWEILHCFLLLWKSYFTVLMQVCNSLRRQQLP